MGVRGQLHHVTVLGQAAGKAECVRQAPAEGEGCREAGTLSLCPSPGHCVSVAAWPGSAITTLSVSACIPPTRTSSFPRSWATSASPAPSTASASHWAPLPRSMLTPSVSSGWQTPPSFPRVPCAFPAEEFRSGFVPKPPVGGAFYQLLLSQPLLSLSLAPRPFLLAKWFLKNRKLKVPMEEVGEGGAHFRKGISPM